MLGFYAEGLSEEICWLRRRCPLVHARGDRQPQGSIALRLVEDWLASE